MMESYYLQLQVNIGVNLLWDGSNLNKYLGGVLVKKSIRPLFLVRKSIRPPNISEKLLATKIFIFFSNPSITYPP